MVNIARDFAPGNSQFLTHIGTETETERISQGSPMFSLFRKKEHAKKFLDFINGQHLNIRFTVEFENDNSFPFLGVLFTHDDTGFSTGLY